MYLEHTGIPLVGIQSGLVVYTTVEPSNLITQEMGVNGVEGTDDVDGVQRHLGWIVGHSEAN